MKAIASVFFTSCGFFTLTLLFRQALSLDVDSFALALASVLFGTSSHLLWRVLLCRKQSG